MSFFVILNMMVLSLNKNFNDYGSIFLCSTMLNLLVFNINEVDCFMFNIMYIDMASYLMCVLSVWVVMLVFIVSKLQNSIFNLMVSMILFMLILCFTSNNIIMFYMFFEGVLLPMFFIIVIWGGQVERFTAGIYMILYTLAGSLPLLVVLILMMKWFSVSLVYLLCIKKVNYSIFMSLFMLLAFLIKLPMFGFHSWLPKAHVEAPLFGSMLLAGVLLKLGGYGLYRFVQMLFWWSIFDLQLGLIIISLFGGLYIGILCMGVVDLKMIIAYSSVVHMGYIIMGVMGGTYMGSKGVVLMMFSHGLCSSCLFCLVDYYYSRFYTRNIFMLKGMMLIFPSITLWWFFFTVVNMGGPPFMNFFSEFFLMSVLLKYSLFILVLLMVVIVVSSFYCMYLYSFTQHGKMMFLKSVKAMSILEYDICFYHSILLMIFIFKMVFFLI